MNIETAIKSRKDAFFAAYDIKDQATLAEIDDLFNRISEFGKTCSDYMDFETKFAASPLNQEYINLFTKAATTGTSKLQPVQENTEPEISEEERLKAEAMDDLRFAAKEATQPLRHQAYMAGTEAMRSTKVGNALWNLNNHLETANHFRKLAKEQKEMKKQAEEESKE
ncbi:hypothetical protein J6T21_03060 [Candidatus Saccharibacteria bacterium]|nr:hypothetical protein [Candidatus Saccharibacteria bacterium]